MGQKASFPSRDPTAAHIRGRRADCWRRRERAAPRDGKAAAGKARKRGLEDARLNGPGVAEGDEIGHQIVDNLPQPVPILRRELDTIETYLGTLLDQMLAPEQRR
jgi:hypothetical protein